MKRLVLLLVAIMAISSAKAQQEMDFPFQGGQRVMADYFTNTVNATELMKQRGAYGLVIMKFTADNKGSIIKMVVYYADDASLPEPVIAAMKGTNGKWIIPAKEKSYDFIIPFSINLDGPIEASAKPMFDFYNSRQPITTKDQVPLNTVSLLPTVQIKYIYHPPLKRKTEKVTPFVDTVVAKPLAKKPAATTDKKPTSTKPAATKPVKKDGV
ncbi:hypothetical protein [Mucilaginibacter myungsuensis]|uniref:TonB-like protein n=1 Tax=Mucilaginibacter myungsuensis TaxID=649104 RepID=A0A929PWM2_9SPHI|nr:hypothetical protein [Mucilaginibacter myungsuensis]MBE9661327.1 hypothetical protein [Mucilaginibacter myungsuensis]MDN3597470.1 hypothetical protein [Mucilaginibacter myungsuensis]